MSDEWLDEFNAAAFLSQEGKLQESLDKLYELYPTIREREDLTSSFFIMFEQRCAWLCSQLNRQDESLQHFSRAMKIAHEAEQDPIQVHAVCRELMDTIRLWENWQLLYDIGTNLVAFGQQHDNKLVSMEAGLHMPFAHRGLGNIEKAREYAEVILSRVQEVGAVDQVKDWTEFLKSLPESPAGDA